MSFTDNYKGHKIVPDQFDIRGDRRDRVLNKKYVVSFSIVSLRSDQTHVPCTTSRVGFTHFTEEVRRTILSPSIAKYNGGAPVLKTT